MFSGLKYENKHTIKKISYVKENDINNITWFFKPRVVALPLKQKFDVRTLGTSNESIVLVKGVLPYLQGRYVAEGKSWNDVEVWVARSFSLRTQPLVATNSNPNRHIDYQRQIRIGNLTMYQSVEVKKTTGNCLSAPTYLRSSAAQLEAMFHYKHVQGKQMVPSIYVVVSYDFCHLLKKWLFTVWIIPCIDTSHFEVIDTKRFVYPNRLPLQFNNGKSTQR